MFSFWASPSYVTFQDVQRSSFILINTLPISEQTCLIKNTILAQDEETIINELSDSNKTVILYGKNCLDETVDKKCHELETFGLKVYMYRGGMFEWMLLQDIYGAEEFPTTQKGDILQFTPKRALQGILH